MKYEATKQESERGQILLFKDSRSAVKLVVAWPQLQRRGDCLGWGSCEFSFNSWCELAGVPPSQYNILQCERLINLNMVFPGGQVHHWMQVLIKNRAEKALTADEENWGRK